MDTQQLPTTQTDLLGRDKIESIKEAVARDLREPMIFFGNDIGVDLRDASHEVLREYVDWFLLMLYLETQMGDGTEHNDRLNCAGHIAALALMGGPTQGAAN